MNYPNYASTADIEVINGNIKKLVQNAEEQDTQIKSKEPIINKKTGFNLDKTDLTENDSNKLFSAKGALNLFNTLTTNFTDAINIAKEALRIDIARKEDKFGKNSGFNREKTDLVENDTNKVFSAKGAFDLKTYLVTNYTTLMNNIKSVLDNDIATKLPHGGYIGSGQDLKNQIDNNAPSNYNQVFSNHYFHNLHNGDTVYEHAFTHPKESVNKATRKVIRTLDDDNNIVEFILNGKDKSFKFGNLLFYREGTHDNPNNKLDKTANILIGKDRVLDSSTDLNTIIESGIHSCIGLTHAQFNNVKINVDFYGYGIFVITRQGAFCSQTYYAHAYGLILSRVCYIPDMGWSDWVPQYTSLNKPNSKDVGAVDKNGDTVTGPLKVERKNNPEGSVSIIPIENYGSFELFATTRYSWYGNNWDVGATRGTSNDISSFIFTLNGNKKFVLDINGNLFVGDGTKKVFHQGNLLEALNQNVAGSNLNTTSKNIVDAINEVIPSKRDQQYSSHYFHSLFGTDGRGLDCVYEHIYPASGISSQSKPTSKVVRCTDGSGNMVKFEMLGNNGGRMTVQDKVVYDQRLLGNASLLYDGARTEENITITTNEDIKNFEKIIIVMSNRVSSGDVDMTDLVFNVSTLRWADGATADNSNNDYSGLFFGSYGYSSIYFRSDGRNIFLGKGLKPTSQSSFISCVRFIWGINRKVGLV